MALHIYINGTLEVPGDSVGLTLNGVGSVGHMDMKCDAGERTAVDVTVNAEEGFEVSKDNVTFAATAVYPAGSIADTDVPCWVKQTASSVLGAPTVTIDGKTYLAVGGTTTPALADVATEAIPAAPAAPNAFSPEVSGITSSGATVAFGTTDINGDPLTYKVAVTTSATPPSDWTPYADATSPKAVTGLTASTPYYAHVRASDGTLTRVGTSAVFTTATAGNQPPAAFTPLVSNITASSATVTWATTDPDGDTLTFRAAVTNSPTPPTPSQWSSSFSTMRTSPYNVTGLTDGLTYYAHVQVYEAGTSSTVGTSASFVAQTLDTTAPTLTGTLTAASTGATQVTLSGLTATDNVTVAKGQYRINSGSWQDFAWTGGVMPSVVINGLTTGTEYSFTVRALDGATNASTASNAATATPVAVTTFSDDFDRADSTTVGNGWTQAQSGVSSTYGVKNNTLYLSTLDTVNAQLFQITRLSPVGADRSVQAKYISGANGWHLWCDKSNAADVAGSLYNGANGYLALLNFATSAYYIRKITGGAPTTLVTGTTSIASGDIFKLTHSGSSLTLFKNGTVVDSATDSTYSNLGYVGVGMQALSTGPADVLSLDDFTVV